MKKLMIAAAIAMVAICSEAVSVKWSVSEAAQDNFADAANLTGYNCYLFTKSGWDDNFDGTAAILAAIEGGSTYYYSGMKNFDLKESYDAGKGRAQFVTNEQIAEKMSATAAAEGFYIIVSDGNQYYKSGLITGATVFADGDNPQDYTPAALIIAKTDAPIGSASAPLETFGAVPEPTSGLLLLLGVAGLALRRRRA